MTSIDSPFYHPKQLSIFFDYPLFNNNSCFLLQAVLLLSKLPSEIVGKSIDVERIYDAVNVILSLQVTVG